MSAKSPAKLPRPDVIKGAQVGSVVQSKRRASKRKIEPAFLLPNDPQFQTGDRVEVIQCSTKMFVGQIGEIVNSKCAAEGNYFAVRLDGNSFPFGFLPSELKPAKLNSTPQHPVFKVGDQVCAVWDKKQHGIVKSVRFHGAAQQVFVDSGRGCVEVLSYSLELLPELPPEFNTPKSAEAAIAPDNCWIERKVHSGGWTEAVYKARTAIFPGKRGGGLCKSRYIGKWGSPAHQAAAAAVERRNAARKGSKSYA